MNQTREDVGAAVALVDAYIQAARSIIRIAAENEKSLLALKERMQQEAAGRQEGGPEHERETTEIR